MHFTLWPSLTAGEGGYTDVTWADFLGFVASPRVAEDKKALEGWSPIRAKNNRRGAANVEAVSAVVLDDDASGLSTEQVAAVYAGASGVVHTSFSHAPEHPKHRVVLRCSRDMTPDEYPRVWRFVRDAATARGQRLDEAPKDASRFWYVPGRREGGVYDWRELAGQPLDVDAILRQANEPSSTPTPRSEGSTERARVDASRDQSQPGQLRDRRAPVAAMLGVAWPAKGRHEAQLALAGALRAEGWPEADALEFLCAVCKAAGDEDRSKREATIRHTYDRPADAPLTGWTRLKALVDGVVVDAARGALGQAAEWNEATNRRLAELQAAERRQPDLTPNGDTVKFGPFTFRVGGFDAALPPIKYMIDGLIGRGDVVMLVAHGNSLKTWLAFSIALAVASGRPWLARFAVEKGRVGILDFESDDYEERRRFKLLGASDAAVADRLLREPYPSAKLADVEAWIALAEARLDLLVIDSFNAASSTEDENDARAAAMLHHAGRFANATGCTVIVIHHARKGAGGDPREIVRGSTALFAACDRVFWFPEIEKKGGGIVLSTMRSVKDGAGRAPGDVRVELSDQGLRYVDAPDETAEDRPKTEAENETWLIERLKRGRMLKADALNLLRGQAEKRRAAISKLSAGSLIHEYKEGAKVFVIRHPNAPS